jgi:hypothetical protein
MEPMNDVACKLPQRATKEISEIVKRIFAYGHDIFVLMTVDGKLF